MNLKSYIKKRVQTPEQKKMFRMKQKLADLTLENTYLRIALGHYANPDNWRADDWGVVSVIQGQSYGAPTVIAQTALDRKVGS